MASPDTWYDEDTSHPVANVGTIDACVTTREGSTYYGLVVAEPMRGDERSQRRLLKKIESYIEDRHSVASLERFGRPVATKTRLTIAVHPDSEPVVFELLRQSVPWLTDNGFSVEITSDAKILNLQLDAS